MKRLMLPYFHLLLLLHWAAPFVLANSFIPDTGKAALHQRLIDLSGRFRVLNICVRPGCEDAALLAYMRFGRGAKIVSAYVTNGEAGENDVAFEYPAALAATRRDEAVEFMSQLDGEAHFINMPDVVAVSSKERVFDFWDRDSLRMRLLRLVSTTKPDLIVLGHDPFMGETRFLIDVLREEVAGCVNDLAPGNQSHARTGMLEQWQVSRFAIASSASFGVTFPIQLVHPCLNRTYWDLGEGLARVYPSLSLQRRLWSDTTAWYSLELVRSRERIKWGDDGLPGPPSKKLAFLARRIDRLVAQERRIWQSPRRFAKEVASILDSVDAALVRRRDLSSRERRDLISWRGGLESLRVLLLGVQVRCSFSENTLTERQLVYFTIDSLSGQGRGGNTEVYFPGVEKGWILDEGSTSKLPLRIHEPYRLVSPAKVDYDLPFSEYGVNRATSGTTFYVFVIHRADKSEENFVCRIAHRIRFAPRLTAEVLTPLVRVVPGERVVVRMTNNSRDGVADSLVVRDSLAQSVPVPVRLTTKGSEMAATLQLSWRENVAQGTIVLPILFGQTQVCAFGACQFNVNVDTSLSVGFLSHYQSSPIEEAFRRLGLKRVSRSGLDGVGADQWKGLNVVVVDRRALTFASDATTLAASLIQYVRSGGRLVILSQDPPVWNSSDFARALRLQEDRTLDPEIPVKCDSTDTFSLTPNGLLPADFSGWIVRRASNKVLLSDQSRSRIVVSTSRESLPLVVSITEGAGRFTYVDLSLELQLANVNPGAFRILANLLGE